MCHIMTALINLAYTLVVLSRCRHVVSKTLGAFRHRENVWLPFIIHSTVLNAIFCVSVVGPDALSAVYREASAVDLGLVCTFSFLWGSGTACFSLGVQLVSEVAATRIHHVLICLVRFSTLPRQAGPRGSISVSHTAPLHVVQQITATPSTCFPPPLLGFDPGRIHAEPGTTHTEIFPGSFCALSRHCFYTPPPTLPVSP